MAAGHGGNSSHAMLRVRVGDTNDNAPEFPQEELTVVVPEGEEGLTLPRVIAKVNKYE